MLNYYLASGLPQNSLESWILNEEIPVICVLHVIPLSIISVGFHHVILRYWHQRADERHGNPPQGNQELLVVRDKVGRPPGELGVSKSMECDIFPSVLWHCWLGDRKGIRPVKNWMLVCWWWWFDWSFARLLAPVVQLSHHLYHPLLQ